MQGIERRAVEAACGEIGPCLHMDRVKKHILVIGDIVVGIHVDLRLAMVQERLIGIDDIAGKQTYHNQQW